MLPKQKNYIVGIYLRLSKDDERSGESLSIENQRRILLKYVEEQNWEIYDTYIDDGISGTTFDRPGVQRMLDDAKSGKINLIICKDLSRFGRNYIQVGQYTDYIFPMYNIRFIALTDNIDTANSSSTAMDMMPIMNVFNEWHAANTSKKLKAVIESNAKAGKYRCTYCAYGYFKGDDEKNTPVIDPYAASIVRRIFELRAKGSNPRMIADAFNEEHILTPSEYYYNRIGKIDPVQHTHLWGNENIKNILSNPIYIGKLVQLRTTTVSYKNHKKVKRDESDWVIIENNHEPIISKELWDKVREVEASVSIGKRDKKGELTPLAGLIYCDKCGYKMRRTWAKKVEGVKDPAYCCGYYSRYGKEYCSSHHILAELLEEIIMNDIRSKIALTVDEDEARKKFLEKKLSMSAIQNSGDKKRKREIEKRFAELNLLTQSAYEDKVLGRVPEGVCIGLIEKYNTENQKLQLELDGIVERLNTVKENENDVDEFIRRLKKYANFETLTREMALELIEYVVVDDNPRKYKAPRTIHIYYKFLDKGLENKSNLYK